MLEPTKNHGDVKPSFGTGWRKCRVKHLGKALIGLTYSPDDVVAPDMGIPVLRANNIQNGRLQSEGLIYVDARVPNKLLLQKGDLLICSRNGSRNLIGKNGRVTEDFVGMTFGAFNTVIRSNVSDFLYWVLQSSIFEEQMGAYLTSTINQLTVSTLNNLGTWVPDLETQRQIADFLDRETARIDLLIEKKQRLVELLAGKKEALRDSAVCKGLSSSADMKSSGVDWFGEVPTHWTVCRFNRLIASKVDYRGRTPEKVDDGVFLVTARNIRDGKIDYQRSEEYTTAEDWEKLSARGKPRIGDIIFTTEAPLGQIAQVDRTGVAFAQRIMKFRANEALVSNDFLAEFMMTASFQRSLQLYSSGSTAAGIKSERLAHLFGLVPPKDEQEQIVAFVRKQIDQLDELESPINSSIDRLKEYRSALITAAVTGQIDVASHTRSGTTERSLDTLQEEMDA